MVVASSQAQTISIGDGPAGSITTRMSGSPLVSATTSDYTGFAYDLSFGQDLFSSFGAVDTVTIWVTETGITTQGGKPFKFSFQSGFTENVIPAGATVVESTFVDGSDTPYGTATPLASETFTALGATSVSSPGPFTLTGPYSITEEYQVTGAAPLSTIAELSTNLGPQTPAPEISTWAMLGLGFAALGFAGYRARRSAIAIS